MKKQWMFRWGLLALAALFFAYCAKKEGAANDENHHATLEDVSERQNYVTVEKFYLDNVEVQSLTYDTTENDQWVHTHAQWTSASQDTQLVRTWKFSSKTGYESFGDAMGFPLRKGNQISDRLRFVADSAGLLTITDQANIPQWYNDYCVQLTSPLRGPDQVDDRLVYTTYYKDGENFCNDWQGICISNIVSVYPFLPPGVNNKIGMIEYVNFSGVVFLYNRIFFARRIGTFTGCCFNRVHLCLHPAYERASSLIEMNI